MLRPVARCAATSCAIMSAENAGWSQSATSAASRARENCWRVVPPTRIEAAMPSLHAGFSAMITGRRASAGRIFSSFAPSTTTTGQAAEASAASIMRTRSDWPSSGRSCFGVPMRADSPAARITAPKRNGGCDSLMDWAGAFAQRAGITAGEGGLHLGDDGERDLFGRVGAEIEADGGVEPRAHRGRDGEAVTREIVENSLRAFFRAEQAEVGEGSREQHAQQRHIMQVVVRHYDGERGGVGHGAVGEFGGWRDHEGISGWKTSGVRSCVASAAR